MWYVLAALEAVLAAVAGLQNAAPDDVWAYAVDAEASQLYVVVHRAGLLSFLGHEHAIVPMSWKANLCLADPIPQGAHAVVVMETSSLVIDSESARLLARLGGGPGDAERREIQDRMLDSAHLAAEEYPEIRLDVVSTAPSEGDRVMVAGSVALHGVTRSVAFPVAFTRGEGGRLVLRGSLRIRQRDFGIEPESRAGLVKVANDVDLYFVITAAATQDACSD